MTNEEREARVARALDYHHDGYNCAQCVACVCADLAGLDEAQAFRLTEGFGAGMGGFSETCGAISGAVAALGFVNSGGPDAPRTKGATYKIVREVPKRFGQKNGSTLCGDLKGLTGGQVLRSCDGCIEDGVRIALDLFEARG